MKYDVFYFENSKWISASAKAPTSCIRTSAYTNQCWHVDIWQVSYQMYEVCYITHPMWKVFWLQQRSSLPVLGRVRAQVSVDTLIYITSGIWSVSRCTSFVKCILASAKFVTSCIATSACTSERWHIDTWHRSNHMYEDEFHVRYMKLHCTSFVKCILASAKVATSCIGTSACTRQCLFIYRIWYTLRAIYYVHFGFCALSTVPVRERESVCVGACVCQLRALETIFSKC